MKPLYAALILACCLLANQAWAGPSSQSPNMAPLAVGQDVPPLTLSANLDPAAAKQLGVPPGEKTHALKDFKPKALILVVYSMYCPFCQQEGPDLNALGELIAKRGLTGKLALAGLAAGNSEFEVKTFRDKFKIAFPLFSDKDFAAYKALGQVGTPYFYVLKRKGQGYVVADGSLGRMDSPQAMLDRAIKAAGLNKE